MENNIWEVRRNGEVFARSTLKNCGYTSLDMKLMKEAGYEFYCNGKRVK